MSQEIQRASTGIPRLDAALEGGVPRGSWVAVTGEPGTGKSILCMHFAWAGLKAGDPVIYITTEAEFRDVMRQARQFRMYFDDYEVHYLGGRPPVRKPQLVVIDIFSLLKTARQLSASVEEIERSRKYAALEIDVLIAAINEAYKVLDLINETRRSPRRHVRLVIDSLSAFWADKPVMARKYSYQLKIATHRENVTALLVSQYAMTTKSVDYNEPIVILRRGRVEVVRIGEFVDKLFEDDSEGMRLLKEPIYTLSMNPRNLKAEWKRVRAVSRHREQRKLLRVKLENGRTISVTPDHSLYALRGYKVVPIKGSEIRIGDLIPTITRIPLPVREWNGAHNLAREFRNRNVENVYAGNILSAESREETMRTYESLQERLEFLRNFTYGDIGFVEVKQIDQTDPSSGHVYDLSVEDNENFFAGTGWVLAHNSTFGFGLEHIADGVIHLWMDDVESVKEIRRYLIIKKMRMTNHFTRALRVSIVPGEGMKLDLL